MSQSNADKADRLKNAVQKNGHDYSGRQAIRDVIKKELDGTKLPSGSVCDALIPLQNPKHRERADIDQDGLESLIQEIRRSDQRYLDELADNWHLTHDAPPVW